MSKYKVGIIGNGFVGESQAFAFSPTSEVKVYDIDPLKSLNTLEEIYKCDFVFVCVPTPMKKDGSQDLSYVEEVFENAEFGPIYILKSTVLPGTTEELNQKYHNLSIIFSPEFLTERTAKLDMLTQARIVLGGEKWMTAKVRKLFEQRFMNRTFIETDSKTAEIIKYMNGTRVKNGLLFKRINAINKTSRKTLPRECSTPPRGYRMTLVEALFASKLW